MDRRRMLNLWREWVRPMLVMVLVLTSVRSAVADWNDVPSGSMRPTIVEGDRIVVNKLAYGLRVPFTRIRLATWDAPHRGDVIVLLSPEDGRRLVKRVVAVPGDTVQVVSGRIILNGQPLDYAVPNTLPECEAGEPVIVTDELLGEVRHPIVLDPRHPAPNVTMPMQIPPGRYFVMGDNRDRSRDSRWFGSVPERDILGRAWAVAVSVDPDSWYAPRWDRCLTRLE
jgi:signal peptidase I